MSMPGPACNANIGCGCIGSQLSLIPRTAAAHRSNKIPSEVQTLGGQDNMSMPGPAWNANIGCGCMGSQLSLIPRTAAAHRSNKIPSEVQR